MKKMAALLMILSILSAGCGQKAPESSSGDYPPASAAREETPQAVQDGENLPVNPDGAEEEAVQYLKAQLPPAQDPDELTQDVVKRLWYLANAVYNVEDTNFSTDAQPPQDAPQWPGAMRFVDFDSLTSHIFTQHGKQQLLSAEIGGGPYIYSEDGVYYHLGAWKTNSVYEEKYSDYTVIDSKDTHVQLDVSYEWQDAQGGLVEMRSAPMTLVKENGRWLVESYLFPEAQYPEA